MEAVLKDESTPDGRFNSLYRILILTTRRLSWKMKVLTVTWQPISGLHPDG